MGDDEDQNDVAPVLGILAELATARHAVDRLEHLVVALVRANGTTWEDIGEQLGMSRQAAQRRFGGVRKRHR